MSYQQSMFPPEQSRQYQQERPFNDDPREQNAQQHYQEIVTSESAYEEGYQGYSASSMQGEKLRQKPVTWKSWQIALLIGIILGGGIGGGAISSLLSVVFGIILGSLGLIAATVLMLIAISRRSVQLPPRTFAVSEHAELSINGDAINVRILRGESNQVEVRGTRHVSKLFGDSGEMPISYMQNGNGISINVKHQRFWPILNVDYIALDIFLPAHSDVQMQSEAGTIDIIGITAYVNAETHAGNVTVASTELEEGSRLHSNAGNIRVDRSTLHKGTCGHTRVGDITIEASILKGSTAFTTNVGNIRFDGSLAPDSDYQFKTNMGAVKAILPADSSLALNTRAKWGGAVHNDFHNNIVGSAPYARLDLDSNMGNVAVKRK